MQGLGVVSVLNNDWVFYFFPIIIQMMPTWFVLVAINWIQRILQQLTELIFFHPRETVCMDSPRWNVKINIFDTKTGA